MGDIVPARRSLRNSQLHICRYGDPREFLRTMGRNLSLSALFAIVALCSFLTCAAGCSTSSEDQRARDERTRDTVAKATERAKPAIEEAGRKIGEAAHEAAHDVRAAAQGAREGWKNGPHALVDINHATENELASLPEISRASARKIIAGRPYASKNDLLTKGVVSESSYEKIRDRITAK
jgi:DNA uptake protein ComE-like DNA-binding protein